MKNHWKKIASVIFAVLFIASVFSVLLGGGSNAETFQSRNKTALTGVITASRKAPKYIFLFIGDGMSYPQIQTASYYLGAKSSDGEVVAVPLSFMKFPVTGVAETYDSSSFAPDSSSTATSIATGNKTYSGVINMDTTYTKKFEAISEKLKKQLGYKIGIITSVNLNHATPAAFYAHQPSRSNYYEIGLEMIESGFDFFAGGALISPNGEKGDQKSLYDIAREKGYKVVTKQKYAEKLSANDGKTIVISETLADYDSISYEIDAKDGEWRLADYVRKGIEMLYNDTGFFMMVEGGKIDWACHANDAATVIHDTIALSNAVEVAVEFYNKHPEDTLILVTGDHETGGLSIGFAGTDYDTFLTNLSNQKISYAKFDTDYVAGYKKNNTKFSDVLTDIEENFGLVPKYKAKSDTNPNLILTDYEYEKLYEAYRRTIDGYRQLNEEEYILYGTYEPLTVTITHILNNKSGINFSSYAHTGLPVPVFAVGNGAELFEGYYDNTDIYFKLAKLTSVK
jgi:alkaline phosphatase